MNATFEYKNEGASTSAPNLAKMQMALKERKRSSGEKSEKRGQMHSPLRNQLSLELSYGSTPTKSATPRKRATVLLEKKSKKLSKSTTQPNLKKSATKPMRKTSSDVNLKKPSNQRELSLDLIPKKKASKVSREASVRLDTKSSKKSSQHSLDLSVSPDTSSDRTKPSRRASMGGPLSTNDGEQRKRSSGEKSPKRGPTRCNSLDLDISLIPESEEAPSMSANVKSLAGPSTSSGDQRKRSSGKSPKRGPTRCNSLDLDLSLIPEAEDEAPTSERAKPPKRSKSFSASSQLSEFKKGESKLRKSSQQKEEVTAAAVEEVHVEAPKEEKPKKVFQFADRLRCKKAVDYSNVDINTIWYSPAEILELREAEQEVQREVSVGYSRACRDSTLLNVEGLYSKKEQLAMSKRRADAKKTVFGFQGSQKGYIDVSETLAAEYGDYSRQAIRGAQKRAARLSSHVDILWNPQEDESDDDTWSDEEAMNDNVKVEMPPSLMPQKSFCYRPKVKRNTSNSSLSTTSLSVTSATSYETLEDGNEEEEVEKEPTVWRSFKRHARRMSLV